MLARGDGLLLPFRATVATPCGALKGSLVTSLARQPLLALVWLLPYGYEPPFVIQGTSLEHSSVRFIRLCHVPRAHSITSVDAVDTAEPSVAALPNRWLRTHRHRSVT
jgi:hypothetical protein